MKMMMKRLDVFHFHKKLQNPDTGIVACPHCFANLVLPGPVCDPRAALAAPSTAAAGAKRSADDKTGCTPARKRPATWGVSDVTARTWGLAGRLSRESRPSRPSSWPAGAFQLVIRWLGELGLGHLSERFREEGVDGEFLCELSEDELVSELGLSRLQSKKVQSRFAALRR